MHTIWLATVLDGAAFDERLARCAFTSEARARAWAIAKRDDFRLLLEAEGETDTAFIDAIRNDLTAIPFGG